MNLEDWKKKCENDEKCPTCTVENNLFFLNCA